MSNDTTAQPLSQWVRSEAKRGAVDIHVDRSKHGLQL